MKSRNLVTIGFVSLFVASLGLLAYALFVPVSGANQLSSQFNLLHRANFVYAAEHGDQETVEKYLLLGMDANATDHNKDTALMGAVLNGHKKIAKMLLQYDADPALENNAGFTALDFAKIHGYPDTEEQLILALSVEQSVQRSISSVDSNGKSVTHK